MKKCFHETDDGICQIANIPCKEVVVCSLDGVYYDKADEIKYNKENAQEVVKIKGRKYFRAGAVSTKEQRENGFSLPEDKQC